MNGIVGKWVKIGEDGPALVVAVGYQPATTYEETKYDGDTSWKATESTDSAFVLLVQTKFGALEEWWVTGKRPVTVVDPPADAPVTATGALVVPFAMAERLVKAIRRRDYCYLCDHVPSHGHADNCPLADAPRMTHSFLGGGTPTCCLCGRPASDHPGFR